MDAQSANRIIRHTVCLVVPALTVLAFAGDDPPPSIPKKDFKTSMSYRVVDISNGDTIVVEFDGERTEIRLAGIDAPDRGAPYAAESQRFLTNLLKGESVYFESESEKPTDEQGGEKEGKGGKGGDKPAKPSKGGKDIKGRTVGYVYRAPDGGFVNLELIRQGYARVVPKTEFEHKALFDYYEAEATRASKGIWDAAGVKASQEQPEPKKREVTEEESGVVFVTDGNGLYHRADCAAAKNARPMKLKDIRGSFKPCSKCKPPK